MARAVKLARLAQAEDGCTADSYVDMAGYARVAEMIWEEGQP